MRPLDRGRLLALQNAVRVLATIVAIRLLWVMVLHRDRFENPTHVNYHTTFRLPAQKGDLLDRHGRQLAHCVDAVALACNPQLMADPAAAAQLLAPVVAQPPQALSALMGRRWRRQMLRRHVTPELAAQVEPLRQAGVLTIRDEPGEPTFSLHIFAKDFQPSPSECSQLALVLGVSAAELAPLMAAEAGAVCWRDNLDPTSAKRIAQLKLSGVLVQPNPRPMIRCCWLEPVPAAIEERVEQGRRVGRLRDSVWQALAPLWAGVEVPRRETIEQRLPASFVYVARELPLEVARQLVVLLKDRPELSGLTLHHEWVREYPQGQTARLLLGRCDADEQGLTGLEAMFNQVLSGTEGLRKVTVSGLKRPIMQEREELVAPIHGKNVELTLDAVIQGYAEEAVTTAIQDNDADWGLAVVVDPASGEVLALADVAARRRGVPNMSRCLATAFEPGSVMKPLVAGAAMDEGVVRAHDAFYCGGSTVVEDRTLTCIKAHGPETVADAIRDSCNMVMVRVGQRMGQARLEKHFRSLGLYSRTGLGLAGQESVGAVFEHNRHGLWGKQKISTVSYGKGIQCTAVELVRAYQALLNGGTLRPLTLVRRIRDRDGVEVVSQPADPGPRVFTAETATQIRGMMRQVVADQRGTGHLADSALYDLAGKTGTSIAIRRGEQRVVSFVAFAPYEQPRLLVLVSVGEPRNGQRWGSTSCGPAVREVVEKSLMYLGVPPKRQRER